MTGLSCVWFHIWDFICELPSPSCAGVRDTCVAEKQGTELTGACGEGRILTVVLGKKSVWNYSFISYKQTCMSQVICQLGFYYSRWGKEIKVNLTEGLNDPLALGEFLNGPNPTSVHPSSRGR